MMDSVYLFSCENGKDGGGIYRYAVDENSKLQKEAYFPCDKPMYGVKNGDMLHVLLRCPYKDSENSGYFTVKTDFSEASEVQNAMGKCACHLCVVDDDVYHVNYLSGNAVKNCKILVTHRGKGPNTQRQETAHTHFVGVSKDEKTVFVTDLGTDTLFAYDRNLAELAKIQVPAGYGIRHLAMSKDGETIYAVNELVPSVMKLRYKNRAFSIVDTVHLPCENEDSTAAAIRLSEDETMLYVSVRAENVIFTVSLENGKMTITEKTDCGGKGPRDFDIYDGKLLICCNENSGNVTTFPIANGKIGKQIDDIPMGTPLCVIR